MLNHPFLYWVYVMFFPRHAYYEFKSLERFKMEEEMFRQARVDALDFTWLDEWAKQEGRWAD